MDEVLSPVFNVPLPAAPANGEAFKQNFINAQRLHEDKYVERDGKHKGIAGTARDVLGFLGDLLLTRLRMPAMYGPAQERRKLAAAQQGYDEDPESAINRVTSINPVMGAKLREQHLDNERIKAQNEATNETRNARIALAQGEADQKTRLYAASMFGTMATWPEEKRKQYWPALRAQAIAAGKKRNVDLTDELPETWDPVAVDAFIDGAVPVGTQRTQRLSAGRLEETGRHNKATEGLAGRKIDESVRHNKATEGLGAGRLDETVRHNQTTEGLSSRRLDEFVRHHGVSEQQAADRAPVIRTQTINGVTYKFKLVGKDWVNIGAVNN